MGTARAVSILGASLLLCTALSGCLVVSFTSEGGWLLWPGSLLVTLILLLLYLFKRR